ncbi:hypothetical protein L3C95_08795 [Chitinophaga filiformis]|uniref:DUF6602 domain-containing protein n=1 Tax=Chitinophaga filiformis TaxID=104663 RepID=UPI001F2D96C2|nr:DUF6602 domain-containing protein [Chitinophaga filiformis]MCF6402968.1 hypothetical protein [Chitinophaga filiformis]
MASNDLIEFMRSATREMQEEYERIRKRAKEDPGTAGDQGEENWATLLRNWLPPTFQIVTKGRILGVNGIASPQVDVIVLRPEYPQKLLDKKLYLADGVLAAFECKITLIADHIATFVENSVTLRQCSSPRFGTLYRELHSPFIYGLLAHSHSWRGEKSTPLANIDKNLLYQDFKSVTHPREMPDLLCVADLASWNSFKLAFSDSIISQLNISLGGMLDTASLVKTGYLPYSGSTINTHEYFTPIGAMLTHLMKKIAWEYPGLRSLASYFQELNLPGNSDGSNIQRNWILDDIVSDRVKERVKAGMFQHPQEWGEWCNMY